MAEKLAQRFRKAAVPLMAGLTVLHLGSMLLRGLPPALREPIWPVVAWYADGLRMVNTWGMFARRPPAREIVVSGVLRGGSQELLRNESRGSLFARVRDARLRKLLTNLGENGLLARSGRELCHYACESEPGIAPLLVGVEAKLIGPQGFESTLLSERCRPCSERAR